MDNLQMDKHFIYGMFFIIIGLLMFLSSKRDAAFSAWWNKLIRHDYLSVKQLIIINYIAAAAFCIVGLLLVAGILKTK